MRKGVRKRIYTQIGEINDPSFSGRETSEKHPRNLNEPKVAKVAKSGHSTTMTVPEPSPIPKFHRPRNIRETSEKVE